MTPEYKNDLDWAIKTILDRQTQYQKFDDYYHGIQASPPRMERYRDNFGDLFKRVSHNFCGLIIDIVGDGLEIQGFGPEDTSPIIDSADIDEVKEESITELIWKRNKMRRRSKELHDYAMIMGDAFAIVWPNETTSMATIYPNKPTIMCVLYDDNEPDLIIKAGKLYQGYDNYYYLNLYYPTKIIKHRSLKPVKDGTQINYKSFTEIETIANPYNQVPVFHFSTNCRTNSLGVSDLNDIIPIQDQLNKTIVDLMVAMEFSAYPQRWAVGIDPDDTESETDRPRGSLNPGMNRMWTASDNMAKFGQFQAASITNFTEAIEAFVLQIARITRTPAHSLYIKGLNRTLPSGEALKTADSPRLARIDDRQRDYGDTWNSLIEFAVKIDDDSIKEEYQIQWVDQTPRNDLVWAESLEIKQRLLIPLVVIWKEMGYSDAQIQYFLTKVDDSQKLLTPANTIVANQGNNQSMQGQSDQGAVKSAPLINPK